jgi:hypothetical protein
MTPIRKLAFAALMGAGARAVERTFLLTIRLLTIGAIMRRGRAGAAQRTRSCDVVSPHLPRGVLPLILVRCIPRLGVAVGLANRSGARDDGRHDGEHCDERSTSRRDHMRLLGAAGSAAEA